MKQIRKGYRDFGDAESKYSDIVDSMKRSFTADHLESMAKDYYCKAIIEGIPGYSKKADSLYIKARRLKNCRSKHRILMCKSCGQRYITPSRCEIRICDYCSKKYAMRFRSKLMDFIKNISIKNGKTFMFLTLTMRTSPNQKLSAIVLRKLFKDARKLINKLYPKKNDCGAFAVLELGKHNNPHIHALVFGHYIPQADISKLWHKITGDSKIVDIRRVKNGKHSANYLTKYIFKPIHSDRTKELAKYLDLITGVRRIHTYGIFYGTFTLKKDPFPCPLCNGCLNYSMLDGGSVFPESYMTFEEAINISKENAN